MVRYSESFRNFLLNSDNKIARSLAGAYIYNHPAYALMITTKEIDYLTFRTDGTLSYLPAGKEHLTNEDGTWKKENRQNGKPGKVIRKLFTANALKLFKQSDFETFGNEYKAKFCIDGEFKILDNKQIPDVYEMERSEGGGSLNSSCMHGESDYLEIYRNCEQLKILTLVSKSGLLCGRSLIWKISDQITLMDRIYVTQDHMYEAFLDYCKVKGWWRKESYKSYDNKMTFVNPNGEVVTNRFSISTDTDFSSYPYIDTFQYGEDGSLNNYGGAYTYNNTDGKRDGDEDEDENEGQIYDEIEHEYIDEDDAVQIDRGQKRGYWTSRNNVVTINGWDWWKQDESIVYLSYYEQYYHTDDTCYSEYDQEDYLVADCVYSEHHETYILEEDSIEVNDEYYHKDDTDVIIKIDGTWYHKEDDLNDSICLIDGEFYKVA